MTAAPESGELPAPSGDPWSRRRFWAWVAGLGILALVWSGVKLGFVIMSDIALYGCTKCQRGPLPMDTALERALEFGLLEAALSTIALIFVLSLIGARRSRLNLSLLPLVFPPLTYIVTLSLYWYRHALLEARCGEACFDVPYSQELELLVTGAWAISAVICAGTVILAMMKTGYRR